MAAVPGIKGQNINGYGYDQEGDPQIAVGAQGNVHNGNEKQHYMPSTNTTNYGYDQPPRNQPPPYTANMSGPNMGYPPQTVSNNNVNVVVSQPAASTIIVNARPNDYLALSIFTCLCCCWPLGLAAIIFSCNSAGASDRMDYVKARSDATIARYLSIASIIGAIALGVLLVILFKSGVMKYNSYYEDNIY